MESLERLLVEFFQGGHQNATRHKAIEAELYAYKAKPQALEEVRHLLEASSPYLQWFAASVLEDAVNRKWHTLPPSAREGYRVIVLTNLTKERPAHARLEPFVATKLQQVLVDMGKQAGGWPEAYPTFMSDILELSSSPKTYSTGLSILAMCGAEFIRDDVMLPSSRKAELQAAFIAQLPCIVDLLSSLLAHAHEPPTAPGDVAVQNDLACCALRSLSVLVEWPEMAAYLTPDLCTNVFKVVQAAVRPGNAKTMLPSGLAATAVMTELMNKKCLPPQLEAFVLHVATQMCMVLESVIAGSEGNGTTSDSREGVDENLLVSLLEFLTVFLEQHLGRVLAPSLSSSSSAFSFPSFCNLLAKLTFEQLPHARLLRRAFIPWATLLEHMTESEIGFEALQSNQKLWSTVAMALLGKLLFSLNGRALAELDDAEQGDEKRKGGSGGMEEMNGSDAWTLAMLVEDDEIGGGRGGKGGGEEGGMSEQQEVISEGVALLLSFARLPACSQDLAAVVLSSLQTALHLVSQGGKESKYAHVDAHTLLSLVLIIVPSSPGELFWSALRLIISSTYQMNAVNLYTRGPSYSRLHSSAFTALKDLTRGFDAALSTSTSTSSSPSIPNLEGVVTELVDVIRGILGPVTSPYSLETPLPPTLDPITLSAGSLLLFLVQRLPPPLLRSYQVMIQLLTDAYRLVNNHPLQTQEKVIQSMSLLLLPNAGPQSADPDEEKVLTAAYTQFAAPLVTALKNSPAQLQEQGGKEGGLPDSNSSSSSSSRSHRDKDLLPLLLRLLCSLLSDHWKEFMPPSSSSSSSSSSSNGPLGEILLRRQLEANHTSNGTAGLVAGISSSTSSITTKQEFVSPETQSLFERMLLVIFESLQDTTLPPDTVRSAIEVLQQLNRQMGLFRLEHFRDRMCLPYAMTVLQLLLSRAHPSLNDELLALLYDLSVDAGDGEKGVSWTFDSLLPQVLSKTEGVPDEMRANLLASISRDIKDGPSFVKHMAAFVGDVCYMQMVCRESTEWNNGSNA
ncbi:exportin 6 [Nannochloropsis oceanica]